MRHFGILASVALGCLIACRRTPPPAPQSAPPAPQSATPTTAEACRACNGDFGVHGLSPTPTCLCRTHDAGKRCRGKDECEADCIGDLGEREVTNPGPPPWGAFVGRCAEFRTTFGCHRFLPYRGRSPAPIRLDEPPGELCVD